MSIGPAGSLAPGKARFTAVSPTIVFKDAAPYLVLGAPGATYITMGNLQVMLHVLDFGMSAQEAVLAPRFAATSEIIELSNRILRSAERDLRNRGYPGQRHPVIHSVTAEAAASFASAERSAPTYPGVFFATLRRSKSPLRRSFVA